MRAVYGENIGFWQYAARSVLPLRPEDRYFSRTDRANKVNEIFIIWLTFQIIMKENTIRARLRVNVFKKNNYCYSSQFPSI